MRTINPELVKTALERVDGFAFEKFANAAFSELLGDEFIPLGGYKDGGADAYLSSVYSSKRPNVFFQSSIEENISDKIHRTIKRLQDVGRQVDTLFFASPRDVTKQDILEAELSDELKVVVRIRDGTYFANKINSSPGMLAAYDAYLSPSVAFLSDLRTSPLLANDDQNVNSAVYVFLRNELDARETGGSAEGLADGLIIWALRDTDSTSGKFLTEHEVIKQIETDVPGITSVLGGIIPQRLLALSKIPQPEQRPVRFHAKGQKFSIAFDLRQKMEDENLQAEALKRRVLAEYRVRILTYKANVEEKEIEAASRVALATIQKTLENEGIEFAAFLRGRSEDTVPLTQSLDECLNEEKVSQAKLAYVKELVNTILQIALFKPTTEERCFYSRIASVYTILFCLRAEPKLIQYFEKMAGRFRFFVGADVLVQTLGERFTPEERKVFSNTLRLVKSSGGTLILTEPVLEEVQHHIRAADQEFKNHYFDAEEAITVENLDAVNRPLIRAYFRGKLTGSKGAPKNWQQFIYNYCNPRAINTNEAKEELRKYLMGELNLEYETRKTIDAACHGENVKALADALKPNKKRPELAHNDASMVYLIYARRREGKESDDLSSYGLKTWWLTNETAITEMTKDLVKMEGTSYLMRPDFLLNFLSFLPKKKQAKEIFNTLFPTLLGVHLAHDHSPAHVEKLHQYLDEVKSVEPARRRALVAKHSDKLKADLRSVSWHKFYGAQNSPPNK